jgi:Domain of unknown function (DUF4129)
VPACLAVGEATWVSLLVNASVNGSKGPQIRMPYLALAIPVAAAVFASGATRRLRWRSWRRALLIAAIVVVGAAATAGCVSVLSAGGSVWRVATHPWASRGHRAAVVAGAAWFVAIAAWARGAWLGATRPSFPHAARSAAVSAIAFIAIFAARAAPHDVTFRATTGDAGVLLFVFFPLTCTALALIRQREIEQEVLFGSSSGPGLGWLSVLAAPMAAVAAVSLLVAAGGGPVARFVADAVLAMIRGVGWVLAALWHLVPSGRPSPPPPQVVIPQHPVLPLTPQRATAPVVEIPAAVWVVIGVVSIALLVWVVIRYVRPYWFAKAEAVSLDADEERDSIFTWTHLLAQVRRALRRMIARLRRPWRRRRTLARDRAALGGAPGDVDPDFGDGVRGEYRRVLVAARRWGSPRTPAETAQEFGQRLSDVLDHTTAEPVDGVVIGAGDGALDGRPGEPLLALTGLYHRVRYGDARLAEPEEWLGHEAADAVIALLERPVQP